LLAQNPLGEARAALGERGGGEFKLSQIAPNFSKSAESEMADGIKAHFGGKKRLKQGFFKPLGQSGGNTRFSTFFHVS
jgi:hypothetical protein